MSNRLHLMGKGTLLAMLAFGCLLLLVGAMFQGRMEALLTAYTESQTRRQAETLAGQAAESLGAELTTLSYVASKIESHPEELERMTSLLANEEGVRQGILAIDGRTLYGDRMPLVFAHDSIKNSFRGKSTISYDRDRGLLFTYPVAHGKNVKYVLYRLYPSDVIADRFSIRCYDDVGKMLIATRDADIIVPFSKGDSSDLEFMKREDIKNNFRSMHREMEVSVAAARTFQTDRGEMLLFEAEIPGTDYLVAGFVPKAKASEGIENITLLVVWVFSLLMLLVGIGAFYLSRVRVQLHESEALRQAKEEAEKAREEAEKASRAKSEFLSNMSHEIRTPINAMLGMNEMIQRECRDEDILDYSENVRVAGNMLLGLVNDILDFSKIEAGKVEIIPVKYELPVMLNDLVNMIHGRAEDKGLELRTEFDRELPKGLYGDEARVKQIITNILTNAVKYTEKGSVTFSVGCEQCGEDADSVLLRVSVSDTGIGIRQEDFGKIFSRFERIEESRNRNIEGTGLGMTITKNLLEQMGSSLKVESIYGEGSVFSFVLKQQVTDRTPMGEYRISYHRLHGNRKAYKARIKAPEAQLLVADDTPMNLMVFRNLLKQTGVQIDTAGGGEEALELAQAKKYDLLILDHMMPRKDGIETLHEIRAKNDGPNAETPAICLTANAVSGAREMYIKAGFNDYLTKPIESGKLEDMLLCYLPREKVEESGSGEQESSDDTEAAGRLALLRDQEWIELSAGMKYNGSAESYLSLLRLFYESQKETAEALDGFFMEENWEDYTIRVHGLKSSSRLIGATAFGEEALRMEEAGRRGDAEYIRAHHGDFLEEYLSFRVPLSEVFAEEPQGGKPEADPERVKEAFEEIRQAAEEMDGDRLDSIFAEMDAYRIPQEQEELYGKLRDAAVQLDYEEISVLLQRE